VGPRARLDDLEKSLLPLPGFEIQMVRPENKKKLANDKQKRKE
jgi:hypothetical protein